ncbi:MAG: hypothetical protein ABIU11_05595, partial [Chitinophagaceae bacterium]
MKLFLTTRLSLFMISLVGFFSCSEKEEFITESLNDYIPLSTGKFITYRVDSMVFTSFGRITEIHKYQVKHVIDAKITDNEGRQSFRIIKYLRDSVNTSSWTASQP